MSSRRKLKKAITSIVSELYADCIFYKVHIINADRKAARKIILQIVEIHDDFLSRVSVKHDEDICTNMKGYFKELRTDFNKKIELIEKDLEKLPK